MILSFLEKIDVLVPIPSCAERHRHTLQLNLKSLYQIFNHQSTSNDPKKPCKFVD